MPNTADAAPDDAHDLLPESVRERLPRLYTQESNPDPMVHCKVFFPVGAYTAYITEGQNEGTEAEPEWLLFGYVILHEREFGYISLNELQEMRGPLGLRMERDLWFPAPIPLSQALTRDGHRPHRTELDD